MRTTDFLKSLACAGVVLTIGSTAMAQDDTKGDTIEAAVILPAPSIEPPSTDELQGKIQEFMTWYQGFEERPDQAALAEKMDEVFGDVDFDELDANAIKLIRGYVSLSPNLTAKMQSRLDVLAEDPGPDGAAIAVMNLSGAFSQGPEATRAAVVKTLNHPGFAQAMKEGKVTDIFAMVGRMPEESAVDLIDEIIELASFFEMEVPAEVAAAGADYVVALHKLHEHISMETRDAIRLNVLARISEAKESNEDPRLGALLNRQATALESNIGKGLFVGYTAPEITFNWTNMSQGVQKLSDLKGKVVILDYWATWCGPCVRSFPNIRHVQEYYDGYDVVIVGVTSLQGFHITPDGERITTDTPEKEYELMTEYIGQQDMTWNVAFSEENVYNPDYGVRGIPHMTFIDAEGKVRYNGLHPAGVPFDEKVAKINKLLTEAGLRIPDPEEEEGEVE